MEYRMGIYTCCYNYLQLPPCPPIGSTESQPKHRSGADLYHKLDNYYANVAHKLLLGAPNETALTNYVMACFNRYRAGTVSLHRLLDLLNRRYVKHAVDEDKGWFDHGVYDSIDAVVTIRNAWVVQQRPDRRMQELRKWGYKRGGSAELLAHAEACAEAASTVDCVIPLSSLALRRFRTEFIELLLLEIHGKDEKDTLPVTNIVDTFKPQS
jgi:hypothetical protein